MTDTYEQMRDLRENPSQIPMNFWPNVADSDPRTVAPGTRMQFTSFSQLINDCKKTASFGPTQEDIARMEREDYEIYDDPNAGIILPGDKPE